MKLARLREWRESQGLTQKELAAGAGASEYTVARAEAGLEIRPNTARRLASVLDVAVADLMERPPVPLGEPVPLAVAPDPGPRDEPLISRPEVREWLLEQGHTTREEFLSLAGELETLEEVERAIGELHEARDGLIKGLKDRSVQAALFGLPRLEGLAGDDRIGEVFRPRKLAWKLEWEIRREYGVRENALVNYSRALFVEGAAEDYLVRGPVGEHDHERHERMLEERRRMLEETYEALSAVV
jgi:transcriptional regulator with XRE-family HTH domain